MFRIYALRRKYILILLLLIILWSLLGYLGVVWRTASKRASSSDFRTLSRSVSNMSEFESMMNDNVCVPNNSTILVVMLVMSRVANMKRRNIIREAYPAEELSKLGIRRLFVSATMGEESYDFTQYLILEEESEKYADILLINNPKYYHHLAYRTLMGLKYARLYCIGNSVSFVIKTDDSVVYNVYQLIDLLKAVPKENREHIFGTLKTESIHLSREVDYRALSNWYASKEEYRNDHNLTYVSSLLYFTSIKTALVLVQTSSLVPYLKNEEVFVTGVVAQEAGVPREDIGGKLSYGKSLNCCRNNEEHIVYKCVYLAAYLDEKILWKTKYHSEYCFNSKNCTDLGDSGTVEKLECF